MNKTIKIFLDKITAKESPLSFEESEKVINSFNEKRFEKLDGILVGDAIFISIRYSCVRSILFNVLSWCKYVFLADDILEERHGKRETGAVAILFSNSYGNRKDHLVKTKNLLNLIDDTIEFIPKKNKFSFRSFRSFSPSLKNLPLIYSWIRTMRSCEPSAPCVSLKRAVNYALFLYTAYVEAEAIFASMLRLNVRALIVLHDCHPIDCLLVQKAKKAGIITATLQHGYYGYESDGFRKSHSDYFLAFGQSTIDNTGKYYDAHKYIKTGMPQLIGVDIPEHMTMYSSYSVHPVHSLLHSGSSSNSLNSSNSELSSFSSLSPNTFSNTFIIIMSGSIEEEMSALHETEKFIQKHPEYKRIIKLHPGVGTDKYPYKWLSSDSIIYTQETVYQLIEKADFAVIPSGSTVLIEYMVMLFPAFIFEKNIKTFELLANRDYFKFTNVEELEALVSKIRNNPKELEQQMKIARTYFSEIDDIEGKYRDFLLRISGENEQDS